MCNVWSKFYNFSEVYEYYGDFIDEKIDLIKRKAVEVEGRKLFPHSDGGFRLRSALNGEMGGDLSFSLRNLNETLEETPCPLKFGDIGCYFVRVNVNGKKWDYIGRSREKTKGITERLRQHLLKIVGNASIHHQRTTQNFADMHKRLTTDLNESINSAFLQKYVSIAFVKVQPDEDPDKNTKTVSRIESMALALYEQKYEHPPLLNKANETKGIERFTELLT